MRKRHKPKIELLSTDEELKHHLKTAKKANNWSIGKRLRET